MTWPKTADGLYYRFDGLILMPVDPDTGVPILMLRPEGGMGVGIGAIEQGEPGAAATFQTGAVAFTELAYNDPTAAGLSVTEVSPGVYALTGALHGGAPGADGSTTIDLDSIGGAATAGYFPVVNGGLNGFDYAPQRLGERHIPSTVNNTAPGNANSTLAVINISARPYPRRVRAGGYSVITGTGSNVRVDLVARLNGETGGNVIDRCTGIASTERLHLGAGPPAGSADTFDKIPANTTATVHIRTEQQSGSDTYSTSNATTLVSAWTIAI